MWKLKKKSKTTRNIIIQNETDSHVSQDPVSSFNFWLPDRVKPETQTIIQQRFGLTTDGVAGPITKSIIALTRLDDEIDEDDE